jgi:hypothetical protein
MSEYSIKGWNIKQIMLLHTGMGSGDFYHAGNCPLLTDLLIFDVSLEGVP